MKRLISVILLVVLLFSLTACQGDDSFTATSYLMGTFVNSTIYAKEDCSSDIFAALSNEENEILSWRSEQSEIYKLNQTGKLDADAKAYSYIEQCLELAERSNGALDITILPVSRLWDFGGENERLPSQSEIDEQLAFVGYDNISISADEISLPQGCQIELGAVGKGIACDVVREVCQQKNVEAAVVSVGGSVMLYGNKPNGDKWKISVRHPDKSVNDSLAYLQLDGGYNISTSGDYEKTFEQDGKTYHHILDASTGYPAQSRLKSVTVISENGLLSDALSTACYVLGLDKGMELAQSYGAKALFVLDDNSVYVTNDLYDSVQMVDEEYTLYIY